MEKIPFKHQPMYNVCIGVPWFCPLVNDKPQSDNEGFVSYLNCVYPYNNSRNKSKLHRAHVL